MDGSQVVNNVEVTCNWSGKTLLMRNRRYNLAPLGMDGYLMVWADAPETGLTFDRRGNVLGLWIAGDPEEANNVME